mmetsp:Transcript_87341/g.250276  ORF Transcript_87341/g.250276 Transcript_87341/m.250276 type:complete len:202 (+) Transcript_87341:82-687(+)
MSPLPLSGGQSLHQEKMRATTPSSSRPRPRRRCGTKRSPPRVSPAGEQEASAQAPSTTRPCVPEVMTAPSSTSPKPPMSHPRSPNVRRSHTSAAPPSTRGRQAAGSGGRWKRASPEGRYQWPSASARQLRKLRQQRPCPFRSRCRCGCGRRRRAGPGRWRVPSAGLRRAPPRSWATRATARLEPAGGGKCSRSLAGGPQRN